MPDNAQAERERGNAERDTQDGEHTQSPGRAPGQSGAEQSSKAERGGEPSRYGGPHRVASGPQVADQRTDPGDEKHKRAERCYWAITAVTGATAGSGTIAAAVLAWQAYRASLDALRETRAQVETAREANQISNHALAVAVGSSVYFEHGVFRLFTNNENVTVVNVLVPIGSSGGTTSRGLAYAATCADFVDPPPDPFSAARLASVRSYTLTLPPKNMEQPAVCSYTIKQWGVIMGLKETIYVYGHASYRDTVDPAAMHYLEFCTRLYDIGFTAGPFNPGPFSMSEECRGYNCADDECKRQ